MIKHVHLVEARERDIDKVDIMTSCKVRPCQSSHPMMRWLEMRHISGNGDQVWAGQERSHPGSMKLSSSRQPGSHWRERDDVCEPETTWPPPFIETRLSCGQRTEGTNRKLFIFYRVFFNKKISASDSLEALGRISAEESPENLNRFFSVQ